MADDTDDSTRIFSGAGADDADHEENAEDSTGIFPRAGGAEDAADTEDGEDAVDADGTSNATHECIGW